MGWPVGLCMFSRVAARRPRPAIGWLQHVQHGGHVFPDARLQQRQYPLVGPQLRNFPHDQPVNFRGQLAGAVDERSGDG